MLYGVSAAGLCLSLSNASHVLEVGLRAYIALISRLLPRRTICLGEPLLTCLSIRIPDKICAASSWRRRSSTYIFSSLMKKKFLLINGCSILRLTHYQSLNGPRLRRTNLASCNRLDIFEVMHTCMDTHAIEYTNLHTCTRIRVYHKPLSKTESIT
jgi:hypothetical protein